MQKQDMKPRRKEVRVKKGGLTVVRTNQTTEERKDAHKPRSAAHQA